MELRYFKDKEGREVDLVVTENRQPVVFVECKWNEKLVSSHLKYLKRKFSTVPAYQILFETKHDFVNDEGIRLGPANKLFQEIKEVVGRAR